MPKKRKKRVKQKRRSGTHHIALIFFLIVAAVFLFFDEFSKEGKQQEIIDTIKPFEKPVPLPKEFPPVKALPHVSIVIDDLGPNKEAAEAILGIDAPLTLSILPLEVYSEWIAKEGNRIGRDIIAHLPMEATRPLKLGNGGLQTWMTDDEIAHILEESLTSVPYLIGASNHMGSAFTQDKRAMDVVFRKLKEHDLFFLDSITTPNSVGSGLSKTHKLTYLRRDVFLDNDNDPDEIAKQWKKLIIKAKKDGHAIALAHPRKNTISFLQKNLPDNRDIEVVPISELIDGIKSY